jgi:hypothetical protein
LSVLVPIVALFFVQGLPIRETLAFVSIVLSGAALGFSLHQVRFSQPIKKAPGYGLIRMAAFFYSIDDVERTFKPIISDWHREYFEALATQRRWKSRWINIQYRYRFAQAMGLCKVWKLIEIIVKTVTGAFSK